MPSLDIAISHSSFRDHLGALRGQPLIYGNSSDKCAFGKEQRLVSSWKAPFRIPRKVNFNKGHLEIRNAVLIKPVTTAEPKCLIQSEGHTRDYNSQLSSYSNAPVVQSGNEDFIELDDREKIRRMKISKANKGNIPWNKGRKHTAETLRRIRERTRLAMQDPKVKMKLMNLGHTQSEETRLKIGIGVRIGWQRRRERLVVQDTCYFEWQNLIAEASRKGHADEEELQWDSYTILDKQLKREWLDSIERRRTTPRPKGSKRAPKSREQRRKISEAISAKWADPEYRERVCSALSKYHGTPVGVERKPKRKPADETKSVKHSSTPKRTTEWYRSYGTDTKSPVKTESRLKRRTTPSYKDPLVNSKLEMIKKIRAQRAAMEIKKREATERAKLLIAEAEKAAKALEVAAMKSPLARASLLETRKLIAEATQSIESIEMGQSASLDSQKAETSSNSNEPINHFNEGADTANADPILYTSEPNGTQLLPLSNRDYEDFDFDKFTLQSILNGTDPLQTSQSEKMHFAEGILDYVPSSLHPDVMVEQSDTTPSQVIPPDVNGTTKYEKAASEGENIQVAKAIIAKCSPAATIAKKKWVCGRLVEVKD